MGCGRVLSGFPALHINLDDLILVPAAHNTKDEDEDSPDMILCLLAFVPSHGLDALRHARGGRCNHRCECRVPPARKDRDRPLPRHAWDCE
jgi:hypothetical protein